MKEGFRVTRVEKEIQQILAEYMQRQMHFPSGVLFSITRVESNKVLRTAKVYYSLMGDESLYERCEEILDESMYEIQKHLNKTMHMKFVPHISFVFDQGLEHMMKIQGQLQEIQDEE